MRLMSDIARKACRQISPCDAVNAEHCQTVGIHIILTATPTENINSTLPQWLWPLSSSPLTPTSAR